VRAFLAPARDQQQRVVDGDAQADQGDQELHDEAHVGEVGEPQDEQERGQDRHGRDDQRHERQERREHEQQHGQGAEGAEQRLRQHAGAFGVAARGQHRVGREPGLQPGAGGRLLEDGLHLRLDPRPEALGEGALDQRERAAAAVGDEPRVPGAGQVDHPGLGHGGPHRVEDPGDLRSAVGHGAARRHGDHGHQGVGGARAEGRDQLLLGLVPGLARQGEVEGQAVGDRPRGDPPGHHEDQPAEDDEQPMAQNGTGEGLHEVLPGVGCGWAAR
jgi:hypothetical protein